MTPIASEEDRQRHPEQDVARWPAVVAEMDAVSRRRQGALGLQIDRRLFVEPPAAGERVIALQLILVGDQAELHLGGRRIVLGRVEP